MRGYDTWTLQKHEEHEMNLISKLNILNNRAKCGVEGVGAVSWEVRVDEKNRWGECLGWDRVGLCGSNRVGMVVGGMEFVGFGGTGKVLWEERGLGSVECNGVCV